MRDFEAFKIWGIDEDDLLGNLLDPERRRGPEVHPVRRLAGQPVRLRFAMEDADPFVFRVA
jgi:hypothetical protein